MDVISSDDPAQPRDDRLTTAAVLEFIAAPPLTWKAPAGCAVVVALGLWLRFVLAEQLIPGPARFTTTIVSACAVGFYGAFLITDVASLLGRALRA